MEDQWYRTDANHQFEDAVEFTLKQAKEYVKNPINIKWIILTFQNALQCACVFYLDGNDTTQTAALSERSARSWYEWFDRRQTDKRPKNFLATPTELFERCKNKNHTELSQFDDSIRRLIRLRNNFSHFYPTSLSVDLSGMLNILLDTVAAIEVIANMTRRNRHRFPHERLNSVRERLSDIRIELERLQS